MEILVRGDKVKVTEAIKTYVNTKLARVDKYFDAPDKLKATVLIRVKDRNQIIEVTIPIGKLTLRAEETNKDLYAAIDLVTDKLERQIRKNKTRIKDRYKKDKEPVFLLDFTDKEDSKDKIVKRKDVEIKPMNEEEAILQMELIDHDFYVFNNADEDCISVLYKRKDGNYGIINTK
jgi:putative sigma-54 modulation protein